MKKKKKKPAKRRPFFGDTDKPFTSGEISFEVTNMRLEEGVKHDGGKLDWSLVPTEFESVVEVLMFGAGKYAPDNWRKVADWRRRYYNAARRHLEDWRKGERLDPESGKPHLAHAACCVIFMLALDARCR